MQQPGSYRGAEIMMMMKCQFHWWKKPEYPEERQITDQPSETKVLALSRVGA